MTQPSASETIYLKAAGELTCAVFDPAPAGSLRDTAVLLCPPFGWEEVCSYRPRREWARRSAAAGYAALRVSYPGTGDSGGGPHDPGRLDAWTESVTAAAAWLRAATGARRVVAIGIELGGLIAYRAASAGAPIDDLVLWATPSRGRALIRQLKAFSALELSEFFEGLEPPPPMPAGELQAGGFVLSAETVTALSGLDLRELPLPQAGERRVLLLERDGIGADAGLQKRLESLGAKVAVQPGDGYTSMSSHPQTASVPSEVIERVTAWLDQNSAWITGGQASRTSSAGAAAIAKLKPSDGGAEEWSLTLEQPFGSLSAIVTEPTGPPVEGLCAVFLNAGAVRRTGPNRMWVETARRWARQGIRSVRLDVEGIGDADGETTPYRKNGSLYAPELVAQVAAALDGLGERRLGERFVLVGLCAGAYWALQLSLEDPRVTSAMMLNPRQLFWDPHRAAARDFRALLTEFSWARLRKNATRERVGAVVRWLLEVPKRVVMRLRTGPRDVDPVEQVLDRVRTSGKRTLFLFSDHEPLRNELIRSGALERMAQWENVTVQYVPVRDHTLRPQNSQRQASEILDLQLGVGPAAELRATAPA